MIPNYITREHILAALKTIDCKGVPPKRAAKHFHLVHNGKRYPPKYVISIAHREAKGREWPPDRFTGGGETNSFLALRGFEIVKD